LDEPTQLSARERLTTLIQSLDSTTIAGVKNSGLFANHELRAGVPLRSDWDDACARSTAMLAERDHELIECLGFSLKSAGRHALVLTGSGPRPEAIAVMLNESETFDADSDRFSISPVAYGLKIAEQQGVAWLILSKGSQLRLYPARIDLGVGRKGLAETFLEIDLPQLTSETAGYLSLIFSAPALADGGSAFEIMAASSVYAVALGARLRDKVYEDIVPRLSLAVAQQLEDHGYEMDAEGLDLAYQLTLRIFFRMLFQTYAEDRKLLPFGENARYDRNALKTVALDLVADPDQAFDPESTSLWDDLAQVWRVIDTGDTAWGVPAYNGGLFAADPELNEHGAIIDTLHITNDVIGPCLKALLLDKSDDGEHGPIDFRSLSVREFGTIYEGLLESSLGLAESNLTLDKDGTWLPAKKGDTVVAKKDEVYFHNTSGQRKGTGSYYTPSFVVEHLLERSLDPALDAHLERVAEHLRVGDQASAADLFFDFRVADLAMGSGHFLTSAIDHIEAKMAAFLEEEGHSIPGVTKELMLLGAAARDAIGPDTPLPEGSSLLRRQIARRCVYGLDINPISVELARVSIWIHTFVRGLPMSSLDHNLVCANSLTGIGSIEEALDVLVPNHNGALTLFDVPIEDALQSARTVLADVALLPEVDRKETQAASRANKKARREAEEARLLFDGAVLTRIGRTDLITGIDPKTIAEQAGTEEAQRAIDPLVPGHMPVLFPEVFLRENGGFDVLVGNPPWEKLKVETSRWWALRFPGLRSLPQGQQDQLIEELRTQRPDLAHEIDEDVSSNDLARAVLISGPFPGIGSGDPDLYQAFAWRNWQLLRRHGRVGIVMPRSLVSEAGSKEWREAIFNTGEFSSVTLLLNTGRWIFDMEPRYTVVLLSLQRTGAPSTSVALAGPFASREAFEDGSKWPPAEFPAQDFRTWGTGAAFPVLASAEDGAVYLTMKNNPRLDLDDGSWRVRPYAEFHATADKPLFNLDSVPKGWRPLYKGESFNLWNPDTGIYYGGVDPKVVVPILLAKRLKTSTHSKSPFSEFPASCINDPNTLPFENTRIAIRLVARATDSRTVLCALVPPRVALTHGAPYLLFPRGSQSDVSFVLGVLSSIPLDWLARRTVEVNLTYHVINGFPVPRPGSNDSRRNRVVEISGRLAAIDERFDKWAEEVGVPVGSVKTDKQRFNLEAELDALVSHLYGLSRVQVEHVFATFHRGWDHKPRLAAVLEHFDKIQDPS
jgi:hypothetical protein